MKTILSILLFISSISLAFAGDKKEKATISHLVNYWNDLHNAKNINGFYEVYDPSVLFYGKQSSRLFCVNAKSRGLLKREFIQEIISPIEISYYNSGLIKAGFRKRVTTTKRVNEHDCYLLFEKKGGKYLIVGESDLDTDYNNGFTLNIGAILDESTGNTSYGLILGSIALVAGGTFYFVKRKKTNPELDFQAISEPAISANFQDRPHKAHSNVHDYEQSYQNKAKATESEKGHAFEKWVVDRFIPQYFDLLEWRGDKIHNGRYAMSNMNPDLEFRFKGSKIAVLAIECKWRKELYQNKIQLAKDYQLKNYKTFEKKEKKKVFIVLGLGGEPSNPENIYIIPIKKLYKPELDQYQLNQYRRKSRDAFFYNAFNFKLE